MSALALAIVIPAFQIGVSAQTYTKQPYSETVADGVFTIYAGKEANYGFTIPADASNAYLQGTVSSRGGIVSQILTTITDTNGVSHFKKMIPGAGSSINLLLPPGQTYYLNFINDALLASEDKTVTASFLLSYDKLVPTATTSPEDTSMMMGNMSGDTTGGESVTISPGSSVPSNGNFFAPDTLTVSTGTTVVWGNGDSTLHTVTSGSPEAGNSGAEFDSSYLAAGKTFQHQFNTAGTFDYYCTLHPFMTGKIIVS